MTGARLTNLTRRDFGHGGAGGSLGFADPKADIGFGYVMNKMQMVGDDDPRTVGLVEAVHASLKG